MQRQTHLLFSLLFFSIAFTIFKLDLGFSLFCGFGAFFPDIDFLIDKRWLKADHPVKRLWKSFTDSGMHRTLLHNVWILVLSTVAIGFLLQNTIIALVYALGFVSHLALDSMTITGIYWLYPYKEKFVFKGPISTGSNEERVLMIIIASVTGVILAFGLGIVKLP